jgi:hypothetical protein
MSTPPPDSPDQPARAPRPLWFYWSFGALWILIGVADLIAQRANLFGLAPLAIGILIWIFGLVARVRRRRADLPNE